MWGRGRKSEKKKKPKKKEILKIRKKERNAFRGKDEKRRRKSEKERKKKRKKEIVLNTFEIVWVLFQKRSWTEMCVCYEMTYPDAHVRYGQGQSESVTACSVSRVRR